MAEPMAPFYGPNDEIIPRNKTPREPEPSMMPDWYRQLQPYSINPRAALEGVLMAEGLGPALQGLKAGGEMMGRVAQSPVAQALLGAGVGTLAFPGEASPQSPDTLGRLLQQQDALMKQRDKAAIEREGQAKTGRGPLHQNASNELERIDSQLRELNMVIRDEQRRVAEKEKFEQKRAADKAYWESPEGKLEAEKRQKQAAIDEENRLKGLPTRERLPGWAQDWVIPAAGVAGAGLTYALTRRTNNQYNDVVSKFLDAQARGDVPGMTLAQGAMQKLESPGFWNTAGKIGSAMLPVEVRGYELYNDLKKDKNSRAYKEANEKIHDPVALGVDVGGALLSAGLAGSIGAKLAPLKDPRGAAIARANPYEGAQQLSEGLSAALSDSGKIRQQLPPPAPTSPEPSGGLVQSLLRRLGVGGSSAPAAQPPAPTSPAPQLQLEGPRQSAKPPAEAGPSQAIVDALKNNPPANQYAKPSGLPDGHSWDDRMKGSKNRGPDGKVRPMPEE